MSDPDRGSAAFGRPGIPVGSGHTHRPPRIMRSVLLRVMGIILAALSVELVMSALHIQPWASLPKP